MFVKAGDQRCGTLFVSCLRRSDPQTECRRGGGLVLELCIASNSTDSKEGSMEGGLPVVKSFETINKVRCSTARTRL